MRLRVTLRRPSFWQQKLHTYVFRFVCKHVVLDTCYISGGIELERFQTAKMTFMVTQDHCYWCSDRPYTISFCSSLPLWPCLSLVPFPRYYHIYQNFKTPFTRYNLLSDRLSNRLHNRLYRVYIHPTGCQTGCTSGCSIVPPVGQPVVLCKHTHLQVIYQAYASTHQDYLCVPNLKCLVLSVPKMWRGPQI